MPLAAGDSQVAEGWAKTLEEASALLREQRFDQARTHLEQLKREMLDRIGPGEPADRLFAITIGHLAVAQAGAGETAEAIWNWHTAQNIHSAVRSVDFSGYGSAGQLLADNLLPEFPKKCARPPGSGMPAVRKRLEPEYPKGVLQFRESGIIIVEIRLDPAGRPNEPHVLKSLAGPITYAALDALRHWRFEPPRPDDPGAAFCVTFNFKL